jgi:hypothetical protein
MKTSTKKSEEILAAALKAAAKITDPVLRAKASAKLAATQKKLTKSRHQERSRTSERQRIRDRDLDFDR